MGVIVVDTGVLIGVLDADDAHHQGSAGALRGVLARGDALVVPASVYAELLVSPFRRGSGAVERVDAFLAALPAHIEPVSASVARAAARIRATYSVMRLPDAFVVATAEMVRAEVILTTDQGWPALDVRVEVIVSNTHELG